MHDSETGRFEASEPYVGDLPLPCIELCAEDLHCHGFVTFESACYFRAGKAKSAEQVISAKIPCDACSLYVILRAGEHGLGHAFSPPPPPNSSRHGTKSTSEGWYRIARHSGTILALSAFLACMCITWAVCARCKRIRNASRDWQRLPDDPSPRPKTKSKDLDVDPGSDPVPAGAADKARFHVDNRPTAMDEPNLMARLAGDWMPWFLMCTPKSRSSSTRARRSSSTSPRPSTSQTVRA